MEKFKIGDWIYDTIDNNMTIGLIEGFSGGNPYCTEWYSPKGNKTGSGSTESKLRLATRQELEPVFKLHPHLIKTFKEKSYEIY